MIPVTKKNTLLPRSFVSQVVTGLLFLMLVVPALAEQRIGNIYGLPPSVTTGADKVDVLIKGIFWLTGVVFVLTQGAYIYYLIKYRRRPGVKAHYSHGNNMLEVVWTTLPTVIFLALAIYSNRVWDEIHRPAPSNAITIDVCGYQFGWEMRYPGITGKLAPIDVRKISNENHWGTDPEDPRTAQDVMSTELVIPVGRPVHVLLHARDVIHSFFVPEFRLYQDCVPGRTIGWVWFQATRTGNFQLACNQLCGTGHYNMKAPIRIVTEEEFQKWLLPRQQKNAGTPPVATSLPVAEPPSGNLTKGINKTKM